MTAIPTNPQVHVPRPQVYQSHVTCIPLRLFPSIDARSVCSTQHDLQLMAPPTTALHLQAADGSICTSGVCAPPSRHGKNQVWKRQLETRGASTLQDFSFSMMGEVAQGRQPGHREPLRVWYWKVIWYQWPLWP
jgi:hypothetical protein